MGRARGIIYATQIVQQPRQQAAKIFSNRPPLRRRIQQRLRLAHPIRRSTDRNFNPHRLGVRHQQPRETTRLGGAATGELKPRRSLLNV